MQFLNREASFLQTLDILFYLRLRTLRNTEKRKEKELLNNNDVGKVEHIMNSMKLVIPLHSLYWSIHTKDESKRGSAFAFIFGVN